MDSPNRVEDVYERPEGLCKICTKDCWCDWHIVLCSEFEENKHGL